ncbi:MAG: hypothetical protein R2880_19615 [Deinococcales bacterium]
MQEERYKPYIQLVQRHAYDLGLVGTPSFVLLRERPDRKLEGYILPGVQSYEVLAAQLEQLFYSEAVEETLSFMDEENKDAEMSSEDASSADETEVEEAEGQNAQEGLDNPTAPVGDQ